MTIIETSTDAFGALYDQHMDTVFRYCYLRKGNRKLAEHLTAEVFHHALAKFGQFTQRRWDAEAWLVGLARNVVADYEKRWPDEHPECDLVAEPDNLTLLSLAWRLPAHRLDCLIIVGLMGFQPTSAATAMQRTVGAVRLLQQRSAKSLAALLPEGFQL